MEKFKELIVTFREIFEAELFRLGGISITLTAVIELILIMGAFFLISKLVRRFFQRRILPRFKLADSAQFIILRLLHYILIMTGIPLAINIVSIQLTGLAVIFGLMGVGIAFGLQNVTSNFVSVLLAI